MSLNDTPRADRLHIGIFGRRNAGKSSLINALTGQDIALVSDTPGTTADPVYKSMELHPVGPVVFIDTAGFDDEGELGRLRVERTEGVIDKTDVAVMVIDGARISGEIPGAARLPREPEEAALSITKSSGSNVCPKGMFPSSWPSTSATKSTPGKRQRRQQEPVAGAVPDRDRQP